MPYHHFTTKDRNKLEGFLQLGLRKIDIAKQLNFDRSSVYREIRRAKKESSLRCVSGEAKRYHAGAGDRAAIRNRRKANQARHRLICDKDKALAKSLNWLTPNQVMRRIEALKRTDNVAL